MAKTVEKSQLPETVHVSLRTEDPWPRMMQWLDTWLPTEVAWRNHPHAPRVEEIQRDGALVLRMELPGIDPDKDVDIVVDNGHLTVSGRRERSEVSTGHSEFYYGEFVRSLPLPSTVDEKSVTAEYTDGILEITLETSDGHGRARHIPIARGLSEE